MRLTENEGIDVLGNIVEPSILSANPALYGSFHNFGHDALSYIHDPDNRYNVRIIRLLFICYRLDSCWSGPFNMFCINQNPQENYSVMGDPTTALRDPVFYRWHAYIDDIFQEFKATIPPYSVQNVGMRFILIRYDDSKEVERALAKFLS